jgi:hypothetical protein
MNVDWKLEIKSATKTDPFTEMHQILSYTQPINDEWIYACGNSFEDPYAE